MVDINIFEVQGPDGPLGQYTVKVGREYIIEGATWETAKRLLVEAVANIEQEDVSAGWAIERVRFIEHREKAGLSYDGQPIMDHSLFAWREE
jgi:hypothetical protein